MPDVVGIRFKRCGKIYDFEVNELEIKKGELVVVESDMGLNLGRVAVERHPVEHPETEFKKVVRKASEEDMRQKQENKVLGEEALAYCIERVMARGLPMKMVATEVTLDRKRIVLYFTADGRIDFRELVKDLAARFKTRIEMRQVGVRDSARIIGGLGICGRELCCKTFLVSFEPISIKMAKSQELVLNANKLSGLCGRLMCCLSYEYGMPAGRPEPAREKTASGDEDLPREETPQAETVPLSEGRPEENVRPGGGRGADRSEQRPRPDRGPRRRPQGQQPRRQERPEQKPQTQPPPAPQGEPASPGQPPQPSSAAGEKPASERRSHRRRRNDRRFKK